MKKHSFINIVLVAAFLAGFEQFPGNNAVFGLSVMGPPRSLLKQGQSSAGFEAGYSEMNLQSFGERTETHLSPYSSDTSYRKYKLENLKSAMLSARFDTNIFENWDMFVRVGTTYGKGEINEIQAGGASGSQFDCNDGNFGFSWGAGTRTTFYKKDNITWGGIFQINWVYPGKSDITDDSDTNFSGEAEIKYWEAQLAIGPTIEIDFVRIYGGPFLHFVKGDLDISGNTLDTSPPYLSMTIDSTHQIREESQLGGFLGAQWRIGNINTIVTEVQLTKDAWGIGVGTAWKF